MKQCLFIIYLFIYLFIFIYFCSMQLAVDVQIPDEFGGLNGEAVYIGIMMFLVP